MKSENDDLMKKITAQAASAEEINFKLDSYKSTVENLTAEKEILKSFLEQQSKKLEEANIKVNEALKVQLTLAEKLEEANKESIKANETLKVQLALVEKFQRELEEGTALIEIMSEESHKLEETKKSFQINIENLISEVEKKSSEIGGLLDGNLELEERILALESQLKNSEDVKNELSTQNQKLETHILEATQEKTLLKEQNEILLTEKNQISLQNQALNLENEGMREKIENLRSEQYRISLQNQALNLENEKMRQEIENLRSEHTNVLEQDTMFCTEKTQNISREEHSIPENCLNLEDIFYWTYLSGSQDAKQNIASFPQPNHLIQEFDPKEFLSRCNQHMASAVRELNQHLLKREIRMLHSEKVKDKDLWLSKIKQSRWRGPYQINGSDRYIFGTQEVGSEDLTGIYLVLDFEKKAINLAQRDKLFHNCGYYYTTQSANANVAICK